MDRLWTALTSAALVVACAPPELTLTGFEDYADRRFELDGEDGPYNTHPDWFDEEVAQALACQDGDLVVLAQPAPRRDRRYSTVTLLARLRGWSMSVPLKSAT